MDIVGQLASDLNSEKKIRREATMQALEWHDFVCWLRDDRGFPIEQLLDEWRANEYEEMEADDFDPFELEEIYRLTPAPADKE